MMGRRINPYPYNVEEQEKFEFYYCLGCSDRQIAEVLGRPLRSVMQRRQKMFLPLNKRIIKEVPPFTPAKPMGLDDFEWRLAIGREGIRFGESPLADRRILQMRNIAHLIDLKRAGHTAALTELNIAQDARPRRYYGDGQSYNTASSIEHDMNLCLDGSARRGGHA